MTTKRRPPRPTQVKVGHLTFTIEYLTDEEWEARGLPDGDGGQTNGSRATILLRTPEYMHHVHLREVLTHELLHACFYSSMMTLEDNLRIQPDIEEHIVGRVSPILMDLLTHNPRVTAFLLEP